jgi:phage anti-repressor protein
LPCECVSPTFFLVIGMSNSRSKAKVTGAGGAGAARGVGTAGTGTAEDGRVMTVVQQGDRGLVVSAKAVHQALGVGRDFSNWLKSRISRYGFEAGADYWEMGDLDSPERVKTQLDSPKRANQDAMTELTPVSAKNTSVCEYSPERGKNTQDVKRGRGRPDVDYWLSLDMAKELAMLERSDAGRVARKYFLECERKLKEVLTQGQTRLEPDLKLTHEEIDLYRQFKSWLDEDDTGEYKSMQINDELSFVVLPEILRQVLHEGGLNEEAIGKLDLRGYAPLLCTAMVSARCDVKPDDIAIRMRTKKMSPRLVKTVRQNTQAIIFGWQAGRHQLGAIRMLAAIGVR